MTDFDKRADEAVADAEAILNRAEAEGRDIDDDEQTQYDTLVTRANIDRRRGQMSRAYQNEGSTERAYQGLSSSTRTDPFVGLEQMVRSGIGTTANRDKALSTFEDKRLTRGLSSAERDALLERIESIPGAAEYALAHGSSAYKSAFSRWARSGGVNPPYEAEELAAIRDASLVRTALNITTGASGQYSLPTEFDPTLIHTGTAAVNPIREVARVVQGTQNVWNGVSTGNVTTYWHAEAAALTDGSPTLAHPIVTAGHLTGWVPASWEFFDDSPMVAQLPGLIGEAFNYAEGTAFVVGTGTSQPLGVVTAISATAGSTVTATTRGSFTLNSSADIFAVANAVAPRYENTSTWIANKKTWNVVRQMSPSGPGSLFWGQLDNGMINQKELLGYPVYNASDVLSTTTTGTVLAVLGDFSQYLIYDVIGTTIEFVQNVVNSSGIPVGQRGLIARKRVGGNVTDMNAFRFLLA